MPFSANMAPVTTAPIPASRGLALVADDEPIVLRLGQMMMRQFGFEVLTATNGQDALELFRSHEARLRVVLLDLTMPILNGVEVLIAIRGMPSSVPVILCSGYTDVELPEGTETGFVSFLNKPYSAGELHNLICQALDTVAT